MMDDKKIEELERKINSMDAELDSLHWHVHGKRRNPQLIRHNCGRLIEPDEVCCCAVVGPLKK